MESLLQTVPGTLPRPSPNTQTPLFILNQSVRFRCNYTYTGYLMCIIRGITWDDQKKSHFYVLEWKNQETLIIGKEEFISASRYQVGDYVKVAGSDEHGRRVDLEVLAVEDVWVQPDGEFSYSFGEARCVNENEILEVGDKRKDE